MQAYNCYVEALRIQPKFAIAWSNLAGLFMEAGDLKKALQYYKVSNPDFCNACVCVWKGIGGGGLRWQMYVYIASMYCMCVCMHALVSTSLLTVDFFYFFILYQIVSLYIACFFSSFLFYILHFQEAIKLKPTFSDAYLNLGNVYKVS